MGCFGGKKESRRRKKGKRRKENASNSNQQSPQRCEEFTSVMEIDNISLEVEEDELPVYDVRLKNEYPEVFGSYSLLPNSVVSDSNDETESMIATAKYLEDLEKRKREAAEEARKSEFKAAQDRLNTYKYDSYLRGEYMDKFAIKAIMGEFERRCHNFKLISDIYATKRAKEDTIDNMDEESDLAPFFQILKNVSDRAVL